MTLHFEQTTVAGATVVAPAGRLELSTYRDLRDHLTKAGTEHPRAVIVDLRDLAIDSTSVLSVFTTVHARLDQWPRVPLLLAGADRQGRQMLATSRIQRFVPMHESLVEALRSIEEPPPRRVEHLELSHDFNSPRNARGYMREVGIGWQLPAPMVQDAVLVLSELVTNVVVHTGSTARIRVELRRGVLSVAVSDDAPGEVVIHDPGSDLHSVGGLLLVAQTVAAWGCLPTSGGGKVVWATLRVPRYRA